MGLFQIGDLVGHSGGKLTWKIECDALTDHDWNCLAYIAQAILPSFGIVEGVPRGGLRFAEALRRYCAPTSAVLLIADDVCTTGRSLEVARCGRDAIGVVAFARSIHCPSWVVPIWSLGHPRNVVHLDSQTETMSATEEELQAQRQGIVASEAAMGNDATEAGYRAAFERGDTAEMARLEAEGERRRQQILRWMKKK